MQEHEIISAVAQSANISNHEDAEHAVRSTVSVLGARLAGGQTSNLAAQLPAELGSLLPQEGGGEPFGVQEFYRRVAEAEGNESTEAQARQHARATLAAFKAGLTGHEYDHIAAQLGPEYADLLGTEPVQHH